MKNSKKLKFILFCAISCLFHLNGCVGLLGRNQNLQGRDGSLQQQSSGQNSFLSSIFGDEPEIHSNNNSTIPGANLNMRSEQKPNRLPSSFQQSYGRSSKQEIMSALSPLHLSRIEGNTWRTAANPAVVYSIMARLLAQSYIISSADRKNFNIQTDWDKFFIDGRLFRNRMSVTVFPVASRQTEVVIKNSVEYYTGIVSKQEENTAWLPSPDLTDEVTKLVENTDKQTAFAYSQQSHQRN